MDKRWWRLVLKWSKLPDSVDTEWMEEHCITGTPEDLIDQYNASLEGSTKDVELIAAIPIKNP